MTKALLVVLSFTVSPLFAQTITSEKARELYRNANWVEVVRDADDVPYFADSRMMDRIQDVVAFRVKTAMRGTVKYHTMLGGCDDNRILRTNGFVIYSGTSEFVPLDDKDTFTVQKGSIGYSLLDYACKNAKVTAVTDATTSPPFIAESLSAEQQLEVINSGGKHEEAGRYNEALAEYNRVLRINPDHAVALMNRGGLYKKMGKINLAIADFSNVIQRNPKFSLGPYSRAECYLQLGRYQAAVDEYSEAIRIKPTYAAAYRQRGYTRGKQGNYDLALADYAKAIQLNPKFDPKNDALVNAQLLAIYNNRGQEFDEANQMEKAIADYTKAIELNPTYDGSYLNRGSSYGKYGNFVPAIADFSVAIRLNPQNAKAYRNRASAYCLTGKMALARADEAKVLAMGEKLTRRCE